MSSCLELRTRDTPHFGAALTNEKVKSSRSCHPVLTTTESVAERSFPGWSGPPWSLKKGELPRAFVACTPFIMGKYGSHTSEEFCGTTAPCPDEHRLAARHRHSGQSSDGHVIQRLPESSLSFDPL